MTHLVIFASGSGSNAINIIQHFNNSTAIKVAALFCNNKNAGVINAIKPYNIPLVLFDKEDFLVEEKIMILLKKYHTDYLILAGFLLKVPSYLVSNFEKKIINIHPSLLPAYGGKGMYGMHVHNAIIDNKETKSGITIHYVNNEFDKGEKIAQYEIAIHPNDTPLDLAKKINTIELLYFAKIIEQEILIKN